MTQPSRFEAELERNRAILDSKPLLRDIYAGFYASLATELAPVTAGPVVELGSAGPDIKAAIPACITTNLIRAPGVDRREDACRLSFPDRSLSNLVLVDVFHHLPYPGTALAEFRRVLVPCGRVVMLEPGLGLLGRLVYGLLHREPLGLGREMTWLAPDHHASDAADYYAAQGNAWRVFVGGEHAERLSGWRLRKAARLAALSYLASGGYTGPQLYPRRLLPVMRRLDALCDRLPWLFAARLLVVLEKPAGEAADPP